MPYIRPSPVLVFVMVSVSDPVVIIPLVILTIAAEILSFRINSFEALLVLLLRILNVVKPVR